jgi:hypothetical protein
MKDPRTLSQNTAEAPAVEFSDGERRMYTAMQARYRDGHDLLTEIERRRLRFIRWLYLSGRINP